MRVLRAAWLGLSIVVLPAPAGAERLPLKTYTTAEGLPNNVIKRIVPDSRGFVWFCTNEGLSRFDGYGFTNYGLTDGLPGTLVNTVLETRTGVYWVGTARGLARFDPLAGPQPMFTTLRTGDDRLSQHVTALVEDASGAIWVGTLGGLFRLDFASVQPAAVPLRDGAVLEVTSLAHDAAGRLWIGTNAGLYQRRSNGRVDPQPLPHPGPPYINSVMFDGARHLWVGTGRGLFLLDIDPTSAAAKVAGTFTVERGLPSNVVRQIAMRADGSVAVATMAGVVEFLRGGLASERRHYTADRGLPEGDVLAVAEDRRHHLWIGTRFGVSKSLPGRFTLFDASDGMRWGSSIVESRSGDIYVMDAGTAAVRIGHFDGTRFYGPELPLSRAPVSWGWNQMFLIDRAGDWWIGTGAGALRYRGVSEPRTLATAKPIAAYTRRDGLAADVVIRLFEDSRGDIWIATVGEGRPNGLSRWQRATGALEHFDAALPLQQYFVSALAEDSAGGVWIGLSGDAGLARYRDGRFDRFGRAEGVPSGRIGNLSIDSSGRVWAATNGGGLVMVQEPAAERPAFATYTTARGMSSDWVTAVTEDAYGRIVAATARGIDRLDPTSGRVISYSAADGLPVGEVLAALRDRRGRIWLTSLSGVVRVESLPMGPPEPPTVLLTRVQIGDRALPISALGQPGLASLALSDGRNLHIEFVAPTSGPADGVRYQVKVLSAEDEWDPPATHRAVTYANLAPGRYRFAVRAINADGVPGPEAGFAFVVPTPIWRRWWFVAFVLLIVAGTGHGFYRRRLNRLLELARVRARIATDLHDDVGANLTRIAVLSEVARRQAAAASLDGQLASIAAVARESVASMSDIVWAISPDRDNLAELVRRMREYASEVFADLTLTFEGPPDTDTSALAVHVRREVFMIFKEAANNAARHSRCSHARITLCVDAARLLLSVADDGAGFDSDDVRDGNGLASMRQRATRIGGSFDVTSAPGAGTVVRFELPVARLRHPPEWVGDTIGAGR